jgi:hypothetical protein
MRPLVILVLGLVGLATWPALAQSPPPANPPVRVGGTVDKLDGDTLTVAANDGQKTVVTLSADVKIYGVEKRAVADIKPGDFVASGGIKGTDGKIHAVEVRIFPDPLRGTGEGQRPWSVKPEGVMTNATVGAVTQSADGGVIHVTYKDGESEYIVGPDVPVLAYVVADRSLLKPGAAVLIFAQKQADGTLTTARVTAEKDGVKPPM